MRLLIIARILGPLTIVLGVTLLVPVAVGVYYGESDWKVFAVVAAALIGAGLVVAWLARNALEIRERDGFIVVSAVWSCAGVVGALPYYFAHVVVSFTDGVFESVSGFTTTGASIFMRYDNVSHAAFMWRSLTHWLGGMGIVLLMLVILPALGIGGLQLYKREVPGPTQDKLTPRLRDTAKALWSIYVLLTLAETVLLIWAGMPVFDSVNNAMATISTGGFSPNGDSIGGYNSLLIEWIVIAFMFVSATNFALHYRFLLRPTSLRVYLEDTEWRWFAICVLGTSLAIALNLRMSLGFNWPDALTKGTFQLVSLISCTGFGSADYVKWGAFSQVLLLIAMLAGGCVGSTSGGIKWLRIVLVCKYIGIELKHVLHPRQVQLAKLRGVTVSPDLYGSVFGYVLLYLATFAGASLLLTVDGNSLLTAIGSVASAMGGVGPGLDATGPASNYFALGVFSKWVLIACMLGGRLELMTLYALLMPRFWRF